MFADLCTITNFSQLYLISMSNPQILKSVRNLCSRGNEESSNQQIPHGFVTCYQTCFRNMPNTLIEKCNFLSLFPCPYPSLSGHHQFHLKFTETMLVYFSYTKDTRRISLPFHGIFIWGLPFIIASTFSIIF